MQNTPRKMPERRCCSCGQKKPKGEPIRVVRMPDGTVTADPSGRMSGRGAYLCRSMDCLEKAIRSRGLERSLKVKIPDEVYETLKEELKCL